MLSKQPSQDLGTCALLCTVHDLILVYHGIDFYFGWQKYVNHQLFVATSFYRPVYLECFTLEEDTTISSIMNSLRGVVTTTKLVLQQRAALHTTSKVMKIMYPIVKPPTTYDVPLRTVTMDDMMEPYGDWKVAYEAERKNANKELFKGIVTFAVALTFFYLSGAADELWMPNLDNIMEDTEPFSHDLEGRFTVRPD